MTALLSEETKLRDETDAVGKFLFAGRPSRLSAEGVHL
jgi:hypothetical protein